MNKFKREHRYLVIKRTDLATALLIAKPELQLEDALDTISELVDMARGARGKAPLCCVVVESDWPEYDPTWQAIEDRVNEQS